jgi:hypothetical protein
MTSLPTTHIPLSPFDSPTRWNCCTKGECDGNHAPVQRSAGSKDDRIRAGQTYFARIHGEWFFGTFSEQWYGWSFNDWGTSGIQLDCIEDLYAVDVSPLGVE